MSEDDWITATDPQEMLEFLHAKGMLSERKARLFACACCRRIWDQLPVKRSRRAVRIAEDYADGRVTRKVVMSTFDMMRNVPHLGRWEAAHMASKAVVTETARLAAEKSVEYVQAVAWSVEAGDPTRWTAERNEAVVQAALLRCIFGNPFTPAPPLTERVLAWNESLTVKMAAAIYEERALPSGHLDPARLTVLADALEDAGCTDAGLLAHLRSPGPHVRGCFAVDAVLGRE